MKKTKVGKKQSKGVSANAMNVQKLGIMLGALESKVAPGVLGTPSTCSRFKYCL